MDTLNVIGPWIWLFFFLSIQTWVLYGKSTPFFRFATFSALAITMAQFIVQNWENVYRVGITPIMTGADITYIIPLLIGLLLVTQFLKGPMRNLRRIPLSFIAGTVIGVSLRGRILTYLVTSLKIFTLPIIGGSMTPLDNLIIIAGVLITIPYFLFTFREHTGRFGQFTQISRFFIMASLGVAASTNALNRLNYFTSGWQQFVRMFIPAP